MWKPEHSNFTLKASVFKNISSTSLICLSFYLFFGIQILLQSVLLDTIIWNNALLSASKLSQPNQKVFYYSWTLFQAADKGMNQYQPTDWLIRANRVSVEIVLLLSSMEIIETVQTKQWSSKLIYCKLDIINYTFNYVFKEDFRLYSSIWWMFWV